MKKFINFRAITQLVFVVVAFALVVFASMGFDFRLEKLADLNFWYLIAIKMGAVLAIHNAVFGVYSNGLRGVEDSKYFVTLATNRIRVDEVYKQQAFGALDSAIEEENKDAYKDACNRVLRGVTSRLSYSELNLSDIDFEKLQQKYMLSRRRLRQLKRVIVKIANGKVKYEMLEPDDLLKDKDGEKDKPISAAFDMKGFLFKQNINKSVTFLLSTIAMTVVAFKQPDMTIWQSLLTNSVLLLNSVISGISMANNYIRTRTSVFEQKNRFLERRMGITAVYIPPVNTPKKIKGE